MAEDIRPEDCRFRLQDEGKPYFKSGCKACGRNISTGLGKRCHHEEARLLALQEMENAVAGADKVYPGTTLPTETLTQTDIDALWLACRVDINLGDVPRHLRSNAQLRMQRLMSAGVVEFDDLTRPVLADPEDITKRKHVEASQRILEEIARRGGKR